MVPEKWRRKLSGLLTVYGILNFVSIGLVVNHEIATLFEPLKNGLGLKPFVAENSWSLIPGLSEPGMPTYPQILAGQLTLSQPGGADYAHYITTGTTGFADLHEALMLIALNHLLWIMFPLFLFKLHKHFKGNKSNFEEFYGCRLYVAWRASLMVSEKSFYKCP